MIVLVHQNLVILLLVATLPLFLVMTTMHVQLTLVTQSMDALTSQLIVTITISVPMILATQALDVNINATNVNTKMLAIL
jgi:hypothetical protein